MRISPQSDLTTLVLLGAFNPRMFHPMWFSAQKAIGIQEAREAEIGIIHPEVTSFKTAKLSVQVQTDRFVVSSDLIAESTQDLVLTIFEGPLSGIPIYALGINRGVHFDVGSTRVQHAIGRKLVPTTPWGDWGATMEKHAHDSPMRGGMISLQLQSMRTEGPKGYVQVKLEPSSVLRGTGIFMDVNNHYNLTTDPPEAADASMMVQTLKEQWKSANLGAETIIDQIMSLAEKEDPK